MFANNSSLLLRLVGFSAVVVGCFSKPALGQRESRQQKEPEAPKEAAAPAEENFLLVTYEVGDIVINIQDHPFPGSAENAAPPIGGGGFGGGGMGGGGGGGFFSVPDNASIGANPMARLAQFGGGGGGRGGGRGGNADGMTGRSTSAITMDDVVHVLTTTVANDTWAENGTGDGQVQSLGTALVVWQTKSVHQLIQDFLEQIREGSTDRKTLTIDARWLLLTSDDLNKLMGADPQKPEVDRKALDEFTRQASSLRAITNCFSGQLVYLVSGTRRNFVGGYIPVVGSLDRADRAARLAATSKRPRALLANQVPGDETATESGVGYQPINVNMNFGALLEIRPTRMVADKTVIVDLKSTLTVPSQEMAAPAAGPEMGMLPAPAPAVDRIATDTQEFATTLRMPLGKPVLVGGMTYMPSPAAEPSALPVGGEGSVERPQSYLVLEVR